MRLGRRRAPPAPSRAPPAPSRAALRRRRKVVRRRRAMLGVPPSPAREAPSSTRAAAVRRRETVGRARPTPDRDPTTCPPRSRRGAPPFGVRRSALGRRGSSLRGPRFPRSVALGPGNRAVGARDRGRRSEESTSRSEESTSRGEGSTSRSEGATSRERREWSVEGGGPFPEQGGRPWAAQQAGSARLRPGDQGFTTRTGPSPSASTAFAWALASPMRTICITLGSRYCLAAAAAVSSVTAPRPASSRARWSSGRP